MISIVPTAISDKDWFYQSCTAVGVKEVLFPGIEVVPAEEVFEDIPDRFFEAPHPGMEGGVSKILLDDEPIGACYFRMVEEDQECAELDLWISNPEHWGRGYGSTALREFSNQMFSHYAFDRHLVLLLADNPRAVACAEKAGFSLVHSYQEGAVEVLFMERCRWD